MLKVSIIIVNWNTKDYLRDCLNSIYETTKEYPFEVLVVDNDSSDGSPDMVATEFPLVNLIRTGANQGFAKANNIGMKAAQGKYLCLINSDVKVLDHCLDRMVSFMDSQPQIGMLGPKVLNPDMTFQSTFKGFPTLWNYFCHGVALDKLFPDSEFFGNFMMDYFKGDQIKSVDVLYGVCWLIRKEVLEQVGSLDDRFFMYSEDVDWCKRIGSAGWDVVYYPEAQLIHYGGGSSSKDPIKFYIEKQRARIQYWQKHFNKTQVNVYICFSIMLNLFRLFVYSFLKIVKPNKKAIDLKINKSYQYLTWLFKSIGKNRSIA